jgi:hypothetical protein
MASGYRVVPAREICPGHFILVPPESGRHRRRGAVDGSAHLRVQQSVIDSSGWVEIFFDNGSVTVAADYPVKVVL